ncbi:O-antigen ligase family protein [Ruegeria sp. 2205SS24-7]|uniref:O-antigen ligase family protein n=1 Tax=Ruegeria discodermiae TaxID=3064389 RepID=UPI002741E127|nr:O-antigen ligase family protein [Ruegeria sp. 2205SS24-7]MDP5220864.1 O-antigen ligase family protein [Ruegeria sp. 2205SS24-7]
MSGTTTYQPSAREVFEHRRDHVLVTVWFFVTFKQFRYDELILYPLALYFGWAFLRDFNRLFPLIARSFILFVFPAWWLLSALWGDQTGLIIKSGMQLILTIMICYCIVTRLSARDIFISLLITSAYYGVMSFLAPYMGTGTTARGVFSSKNTMGTAMVILWLASLCVLVDPGFSRKFRLFAVATAGLAILQIHRADSATAVLLAIGILGLVFLLGIVPRSGILRRPWFYVAGLTILGALFLASAWFFSSQTVDPVNAVLGAFGKDGTLTGRTVLWQYATRQIEQTPLLGVGAGGFWTPYDKLSEASRIYEEFHKASYATFSFHNSYYEIAVHQGLIGLFFCVLTVVWTIVSILIARNKSDPIASVFFLCVCAVTLARSMTESDLLAPFALLTILFLTGGLMSRRSVPETNSSQAREDAPATGFNLARAGIS